MLNTKFFAITGLDQPLATRIYVRALQGFAERVLESYSSSSSVISAASDHSAPSFERISVCK